MTGPHGTAEATGLVPRVLRTAAGDVELAEVGSGPPVLVLHGTPGDWSQAVGLAADLAPRHRVLLPSRPGYGRTPLSTGRTVSEQAVGLVAALDVLGVARTAVVGVSGGGPAARAVAAQHRDRVSRLVLCCPVAEHLVTVPRGMRLLAAVPGLWPAGAAVAARRTRRGLGDRAAVLAAVVAELGPAERAALDDAAEEDLLAFAAHRRRVLTSVPGLRNDFRQFQRTKVGAAWPAGAAVATLVLHGDVDTVVPLAHGEHHAATIPGAVLEVLPGIGHAFPVSRRRATAERIAAHLAPAGEPS